MTQENSKILEDQTAAKPDNAQTLNVTEIRARIKELSGEAVKAHDNKESLVAKLAGIASPYVAASFAGYTEIRVVAEIPPKVDGDGNVIHAGKPGHLEHVQHPPKALLSSDVAKFIREAMDLKPEKLEGDAGDSVKSRISYKNTTVDQTAAIAAKASILIAKGADGMTVAFFVGRRAVPMKDGKAPKGAVLRLAIPHNIAEPHLKFKGNPVANPNAELIIAAPAQVSTSWQACMEGKQRDAYGKIVRGVKAGTSFDWAKAIGDLAKALAKDAGDATAPYSDILTYAKALDNLAGVIDTLMTKAAKEYPEEFGEAMGEKVAQAA
jgi:hypothetical protein